MAQQVLRGGEEEEDASVVVDIAGDGGCLLHFSRRSPADDAAPLPSAADDHEAGLVATVRYVGRFPNGVGGGGGGGGGDGDGDGAVFDANEAFSFVLGRNDVIRGFEAAARRLRLRGPCGPYCKAKVFLRHDWAYGEEGLAGRVPPHAALEFDMELLKVERPSDAALAAGAVPALPPAQTADERVTTTTTTTTVVVNGAPLKLDALGPIVINSDGSSSRITNWPTMTEAEQQNTMRLVAKRNKKRLATLNATSVAIGAGAAPP